MEEITIKLLEDGRIQVNDFGYALWPEEIEELKNKMTEEEVEVLEEILAALPKPTKCKIYHIEDYRK